MGTLKTLLLAQAIVAILDSKEASKTVYKLAVDIEKLLDEKFGENRSEAIQHSIVGKLLLPLCSHLMRDGKSQLEYMKLLQIEYGVVGDEYHKDNPEMMT